MLNGYNARRFWMPTVNPIPKERAAAELKGTFEGLQKKFGRAPNIFAVMAHRPSVLKTFLPFFSAVMSEGTVDVQLKELAYLKTAMLNGCEY